MKTTFRNGFDHKEFLITPALGFTWIYGVSFYIGWLWWGVEIEL